MSRCAYSWTLRDKLRTSKRRDDILEVLHPLTCYTPLHTTPLTCLTPYMYILHPLTCCIMLACYTTLHATLLP